MPRVLLRVLPLRNISLVAGMLAWSLLSGASDSVKAQAAPAEKGDNSATSGEAAQSTAAAEKLSAVDLFALLREADAAFRQFDHQRACALYEQITRANPYNGDYWLRLARCQERTGQADRAIASFERGLALGDDSSPGQTQYQIAVLQARAGHVEAAVDWLEKALAARHEHRSVLRTDTRLDALRSEPRFAKLAAAAENADQLSRDERWGRDLDHLLEEAARMHVLWHEGDRAERFRQAVEALRPRIATLSDEQMLAELQKVVVLLGDGHTLARSRAKSPRLPLQMYFFTDGMFVINASDEHRDLVGCRIDKIGNVSALEAERLLEQMVSRDNPMGIKANGPFSLTDPARLLSLGIIDDPHLVRIKVTDQAGAHRTVDLEPDKPQPQSRTLTPSKLADAPEPPLYLRRADENLWFERLPDMDGLYVQFNDVGDQKGRQLAEVARRLREELSTNSPKVLVLDVRNNGGGNTYLYAPLLKALLFYELTQPEGKLFAIIGRNTFSAAQNFTNDVDRLTNAIFVGEPTGSRPSFAGEGTQAVLPYSGVSLSISTRVHAHCYATDRRIWIAPDVPAELSSADYFANRDPALEAIQAIITQTAPSNAASGK